MMKSPPTTASSASSPSPPLSQSVPTSTITSVDSSSYPQQRQCHRNKMASHSMILFFCCVTMFDAFMSFQYGRSMRKLLKAEPCIDNLYSITNYEPILVHLPFEPSPPYGNRIGSAANRFYYYDSSKTKDKGDDNDVSAAAISHIKKMNDDEEDEEIIVLSNMDSEWNVTNAVLKRVDTYDDQIIGSVDIIDEMEIDNSKDNNQKDTEAAILED